MIKVSIPLSFEREEVTRRRSAILLKKGMSENQKKVYDYLSTNPSSSLQETANVTGLSLGGVKKRCTKLQELGLLERVGSKRDGKWKTK